MKNKLSLAERWLRSVAALHPTVASCGDVSSASAALVAAFGRVDPAAIKRFSAPLPASVFEHPDRRVRIVAARLAPRALAERFARDADLAVAAAARERLAEIVDPSASPEPEVTDFSDEWYRSLAQRVVNDHPSRSTDPDDRSWVEAAVAAVVRAKRSVMGVEIDAEKLSDAVEATLDDDGLAPPVVVESTVLPLAVRASAIARGVCSLRAPTVLEFRTAPTARAVERCAKQLAREHGCRVDVRCSGKRAEVSYSPAL